MVAVKNGKHERMIADETLWFSCIVDCRHRNHFYSTSSCCFGTIFIYLRIRKNIIIALPYVKPTGSYVNKSLMPNFRYAKVLITSDKRKISFFVVERFTNPNTF